MKKVAIFPTLLTLGNAACGFAAIVWASKIDSSEASEHYFAVSGWLIMAAMVFDAFDGYVARLSRTASKFGGELDSLCDAISFGAAPAFLLLKTSIGGHDWPLLHQFVVGAASLYLVCALLRLARFNVESTAENSAHKRFRGLPSPGAAGCLASLAVLRGELYPLAGPATAMARGYIEIWASLGGVLVALLMVSRVPYPHLTKQMLRGRRHFAHLIEVVVAGFLIFQARQVALVLLFWIYALGVFARYVFARSLRREARPAAAGFDDLLPR